MIRKFAQPVLASVFVADGVDTLMNQKDHKEGVHDLITRVCSVILNQYNKYVPRSEETVIQAITGTRVAAGSLYALGRAPRLSATVLVTAQVPTMLTRHAFWGTQNSKEKAIRRTGFLTDIGLLGGLFLAIADTDGKLGVAWHAEKADKQLNKKVQTALPAKSRTEQCTEEISAAFASAGENAHEGTGLLHDCAPGVTDGAREYVEENRGGWCEQLTDAFDTARSYVEGSKDDWISKATGLAEGARNYAEDLGRDLREDTHKQCKELRRRAAKTSEKAKKSARKTQKRLQ